MRFTWQRRHWVGGWLALALAARSFAHGPLDHSATITLTAEQIEVRVTLGPDLARKFFAEHLPGAPLPQPVGPGASLPVAAVEKMFSLTITNSALTPAGFRGLTDGLEYVFVATFPGVAAASLRFHAHYFALAEQMPPGALLLQTEGRQRLAAEILSPTRTSAEMPLPPASIEARPVVSPPMPATTIVSEPIGSTNQPGVVAGSTPGQGRFVSLVTIGLVAAILVGFLLSQRRGG